jgi:hypothetical protein
MFDYMKLAKLISTMCDEKRIKYARSLRVPVNVEKYLEDNDIQLEGCTTFLNEENIRIFIIFGKSDYAMMHDIIDNKYTFCIFADYILRDEIEYMEMYEIVRNIVYHILRYVFPDQISPIGMMSLRCIIKDTFRLNIKKTIDQISAYNIWTIGGDRFLDEYKEKYPDRAKDIEKVMELFDQTFK